MTRAAQCPRMTSGDSAGEAELFQHRPVFRPDEFDGLDSHLRGARGEFFHLHRIEAPVNNGLFDAPVFGNVVFFGSGSVFHRQSGSTEAGGGTEEMAAVEHVSES